MSPDEFLNNHLLPSLYKPIVSRNIQSSEDDNSKSQSREDNAEYIKSHAKERHKRFLADLPRKIDWRERGVITDVKNQKNCGACWAFSVVENMEAMKAMKTNKLEPLSVQEMIDCAGYENDGCNGGDMCTLLRWMHERNVPVVPDADYPLHLKTEECKLKENMNGVQIEKYGCDR